MIHSSIALLLLLATSVAAVTRQTLPEPIIDIRGKGRVAVSTRGPSAFRVRFLGVADYGAAPVDTPIVLPDKPDAPYKSSLISGALEVSTSYGAVSITPDGVITLKDALGKPVATTAPMDILPDGVALKFISTDDANVFGGGASVDDAQTLPVNGNITPAVENMRSHVPYYYSTAGYGALGVVDKLAGNSKQNAFPATYMVQGSNVSWVAGGRFELYLMPASTLDVGTQAYYSLLGAPKVPPLYAFGFLASRWGWKDRDYIEETLQKFRNGSFPIDAIIGDFEWFTNVSDYAFPPTGFPWYTDFGYGKATFPEPAVQLADYNKTYHVRFGGIRKPRLGNTSLLAMAKSKSWLLPSEEEAAVDGFDYALGRNLNYSKAEVRAWYGEQQKHYYEDGVSFWWNDEGETSYFTFHWWNEAHLATLRDVDPTSRFFSLNRAFSPGMARLGATVWTGDIDSTWLDLQRTPGFMLNWALSGAPYVACDVGGFQGNTTGHLLTRWMQVAAFMPIMRVHSTLEAVPHFPFLFPDHTDVLREALEIRYRLLPYHYSLAHRMHEIGKLWVRSTYAEFNDSCAINLTTQWFDGDLLVAPVLREDDVYEIYVPRGTWYHFNTSTQLVGPTNLTGIAAIGEVPVLVPAGAIVPLAPVIQYTDALPGGPLEVQAYVGSNGTFTLVEDDGHSRGYESGAVRRVEFTLTDTKSSTSVAWKVSGSVDVGPNMFRQLYVKFFHAGGITTGPVIDIAVGSTVQLLASHAVALTV